MTHYIKVLLTKKMLLSIYIVYSSKYKYRHVYQDLQNCFNRQTYHGPQGFDQILTLTTIHEDYILHNKTTMVHR